MSSAKGVTARYLPNQDGGHTAPLDIPPPAFIRKLVEKEGALIFLSHSGGKDSQAMTAYIQRHFKGANIVVAHSHLVGMEWEGVLDHIKRTIGTLPLEVCTAKKLDGSQNSFKDLVLRRASLGKPAFPSSAARFCTSDLKRGPLERTLKAAAKQVGTRIVLNCMGLRAGESSARKNMQPFKFNKRASIKSRKVYDWLPIHSWSTDEVFDAIAAAGQKPHWACEAGSSRLSCGLCILASKRDLAIGAKHNPQVFADMVELERVTGSSFRPPTKSNPNPCIKTLVQAEWAKQQVEQLPLFSC